MTTLRPSPSAAVRHDSERVRAEAQMRVLGLLIAIGMAMARLVGFAFRPSVPRPQALMGLNFNLLFELHDRISRAVRLAIVLQARVQASLSNLDAAPQAEQAAEAERSAKPERPERMDAMDLLDRFDRPEFGKASLDRPVEDLIGYICRDLGLDPAWTALAAEAPVAPPLAEAAATALQNLADQACRRQARVAPSKRPVGAAGATRSHLASPVAASP